jgi:cytochrome b561
LELPALIGENKALAKQVEEIHETIGNVGYFLIGIHAAAALFHHYIQRDDTLARMLPSRSPKSETLSRPGRDVSHAPRDTGRAS